MLTGWLSCSVAQPCLVVGDVMSRHRTTQVPGKSLQEVLLWHNKLDVIFELQNLETLSSISTTATMRLRTTAWLQNDSSTSSTAAVSCSIVSSPSVWTRISV